MSDQQNDHQKEGKSNKFILDTAANIYFVRAQYEKGYDRTMEQTGETPNGSFQSNRTTTLEVKSKGKTMKIDTGP